MNDEGIVKQLLDAGGNADIRNQCWGVGFSDETPLYNAACLGRLAIAKMLLAHGANVNATSTRLKWTPLHVASSRGEFEVARLLLQHGANPDAKDQEGNAPVDVCYVRSHREMSAIRALFREYGRTAKDGGPK